MALSTLMRWLPRALRERVVRSKLGEIDATALAGIQVKLAETAAEVEGAARLVQAAYLARGIAADHHSGVRVTPHLLLPTTMVFVAVTRDGTVVGTISLVVDSRLGLPLEAVYCDEVARLRRDGRRLAEVGALSLASEYRHSGLVHLLNKIMVRVALERCGIDHLVICVHPRAEDFYRGALLFERIGDERHYAGLNASARAVALRLELPTLRARYLRAFGPGPATVANAYHFYFVRQDPQIRMPRDAPSIERRMPTRREASNALLAQRGDAITGLTREDRAYLASVLGRADDAAGEVSVPAAITVTSGASAIAARGD